MALLAQINDVRISDPDGKLLVVGVSFMDDTLTDQKSGEPLIVASSSFRIDPKFDKQVLYDQLVAHGQGVSAARAAAVVFASQYPPGTRITVG